jgi:hypothetical protein
MKNSGSCILIALVMLTLVASTTSANNPRVIVINVDSNGTTRVAHEALSSNELTTAVLRAVAQEGIDLHLALVPDTSCQFKHVYTTALLCMKAGTTRPFILWKANDGWATGKEEQGVRRVGVTDPPSTNSFRSGALQFSLAADQVAIVSDSGELLRTLNTDIAATRLIDDLRANEATRDAVFVVVGKDGILPNMTYGIRQPMDGASQPSLPIFRLAAGPSAINEVTGVKMADLYRDFISYVKKVQTAVQDGTLAQPQVPAPDKGAIFVDGFGWIQPALLDWCLTLRPLQLRWDSSVLLVLVEGNNIASPPSDRTPQWFANMNKQGDKWVLAGFTAVHGKPVLMRLEMPGDIPNKVLEDIGTNAPNLQH